MVKKLPDLYQIVRGLVLIIGTSVLVGAFLFHVWVGLPQLPERWPTLLMDIYYSFIYTTIMYVSVKGTIGWLHHRISVQSKTSVLVHAGILSLVAMAAYVLATALCWGLHSSFSIAWEALLVTATIAFVVTLIWSSFVYLNKFYQELRKAEAARYEARLEALRAQINPHFLFNAFNSIAALIRTRPDEAETVVEDLADLFRYTLRASKHDLTSLEKEILAAQRYLTIEKARFRDRLQVEIDVPEPLYPVSLPSMTIQPLVENAVKHGVGQTQETCTVTIAARRENGHLSLRVTDTGPGFDTVNLDAVVDEGTGLGNVRERLRLFYGDDAHIQLLEQGVEITVPLVHGDDDSSEAPVSSQTRPSLQSADVSSQ